MRSLRSTRLSATLLLAACGGSTTSTAVDAFADAAADVAADRATDAALATPDAAATGTDAAPPSPRTALFSPYKDATIHMNWNTNVISTQVSGVLTPLGADLAANGARAVTLAFATGECGAEGWAGVPGETMAAANVAQFDAAGVDYVLSSGGAAGVFTCGSDAGFEAFLARWASPHLIGVDFDIEAGQTDAQIDALLDRVVAARRTHPELRFSFTLATLANNNGADSAQSIGALSPSLNVLGLHTLDAVKSKLGFTGDPATWPAGVTVNLMTMDYGAPAPGVCVVRQGVCAMGQSALQAAYNLRDTFGVPFSAIELTPMIGGNDTPGETFTLPDVDAVVAFVRDNALAGLHFWSYDRDVDCPAGPASATCNSVGDAGAYGFLKRFLAGGSP